MKKIIVCMYFLLLAVCIYSQNFSKAVDEIIDEKKIDELDVYLKLNKDSKDYKDIEKYIIEKTKEIILAGYYDNAKLILRIILDNNLKNNEAKELFLSLEKMIEEKRKIEKEKFVREKRKIEKEKKEKIKITPKNFSFNAYLGIADFCLFYSDIYSHYFDLVSPNVRYGLSGDVGFYFNHPYIALGIDGQVDGFFVNVYNKGASHLYYKAAFAITTPLMKIPLYLRIGVSQFFYFFKENMVEDIFVQSLISPTLGFKIKDYFFNKVLGIYGSMDYYFISFLFPYIDAYFDASFGFLFRIFSKKNISMIIRFDMTSLFLISYKRLETNNKIKISLGIKINEK